MRHLKSGRKLGVDSSHRKALIRSLALALIERDQIKTTPARAKELRRYADRVVTWAKRGDLAGKRLIVQFLGTTETKKIGENRVRNALDRLCNQLAPRFKDRNGGYTQILKLSRRRVGDNAQMCMMRYLPEDAPSGSKGGNTKKKKTAAKKKKVAKTTKAAASPKQSAAPKKKTASKTTAKKAADKKTSKSKKV